MTLIKEESHSRSKSWRRRESQPRGEKKQAAELPSEALKGTAGKKKKDAQAVQRNAEEEK